MPKTPMAPDALVGLKPAQIGQVIDLARSEKLDSLWQACLVAISTSEGPQWTQGVRHPHLPGIAITQDFVEYTVTHIPSGTRMSGPWQLVVRAQIAAAEMSALADFSQSAEKIAALSMNTRMALRETRGWPDWEFGDEFDYDALMERLEKAMANAALGIIIPNDESDPS